MVLIHDYEIIKFGKKHLTENIHDVIISDPSYCIWLLNQSFLNKYPEIKQILEANFNVNDICLWWGRNKGKTLSWIKENDPTYITYLKIDEYVKTNDKCKNLLDILSTY
jgi:hypothetical protein